MRRKSVSSVNKNNLYIVIPAYNESENIAEVIHEWYPIVEKISSDSRIVIINDGSKDKTFEIAHNMIEKLPQLLVLDKSNSGHGATCLYGYTYALQAGAQFVFQTDADGQTLATEFWNFWKAKDDYDFIIGSRDKRQDGFSRIVITKTLKWVVRAIFGVNIQDANTPYRLMRGSRLKEYMDVIPKNFFLSNVLLSTLAVKREESVKWFTITFRPRQAGENSLNIKKIIKIGYKAIYNFREFIKENKIFINSKVEKNKRG